ncbi:hypothetical protein Ahy_B10g101785 [Arachis hypogaea]|uniref:Ubiquitin-like protease family profile domain-containing protein n=1 Tax=Arachis hypogaea TaxID=3818 RepID=A0A444X0H4_ARAHY|nr:hypothetical protein Ahy_B10g101785 [Arachis hypogaea]
MFTAYTWFNYGSVALKKLKISLTSSVIEDLFKDDYVYEVSNEDPAKEQQQQAQQPPVQQQSEQEAPVNVPLEQQQQLCEEPTSRQSKQEAPVDVFFKDADVYQVSDEEQSQEPPVAWQSEKETLILSSFDSAAQPRERKDERPSFSLGISPPASQPTQPSQESVSELEILAEAVVDAGVTTVLKFAEGTSSEPTLPAAQVYKTPQKKTKITNELIEKCYHWMTHVKKTKDSSNEYLPIFVLKHEALYEGLREYFMSLMPKEQVHAVNFMLGTHGVKYTDKMTNKAYSFNIEQYAHHRQFFDKRKLASHPFLFVPICNGGHWWLWIADVNKKKFYVLDPINKKPEDIPDSRKELNKFVVRFNNFPDESVCWGGTLNGGWTGRGSRYLFFMEKYYSLATVFNNMSQEKKDIVEEMGFGALAHVPEMNVSHALLRKLIDFYDEYRGCLKTLHEKIYITPAKVAAALGISHDGEENRQKFRRTFVIFVQKCFLLRMTISMASAIHKPPIFCVDNIRQWDWANHVLSFLRNGIENKRKGKKQSIEGCVFVLLLIYFHETKFPRLNGLDAPPAPWVAYCTKKMMLDRISEEATDTMMLLKYSAN